MKVAITGASGFIGKLLVKKHLEMGDEINILSRKNTNEYEIYTNVKFFLGDICNIDSLVDFVEKVDVLYHCAAEIKEESKMQLINEEGTKNLIKVASGKIKHWVQLSSTGVYGAVYDGQISEEQPYNPNNEYERTKLNSDLLLLKPQEKLKFTFTIIRPSNVFGYQMKNQSIFQLIKSIEKGFYFFIGPKGASANYVPVENVIEAMYLAAKMTNAVNEIFIVSNSCSIEEFVDFIAKELGVATPKKRVPVSVIKFLAKISSFIPNNPLTISRVLALSNRVVYKTTKIENKLSYKSKKSIQDTIADLVSFHKGVNN